MTDSSAILVLVETADGRPIPLGHELLGLARRLSDAGGGDVVALVPGSELGDIGADLVARGADRVCLVDDAALAAYQADAWMADTVAAAQSTTPGLILLGHTSLGADLAPRLAFRLGGAVTTGCIEVAAESDKLLFTRPCYGGNALEVASFTTTPFVATIKPKTQQPLEPDPAREGDVLRLASVLEPGNVRTRIKQRMLNAAEEVPLEAADVIVAGGGGMKGPAGLSSPTHWRRPWAALSAPIASPATLAGARRPTRSGCQAARSRRTSTCRRHFRRRPPPRRMCQRQDHRRHQHRPRRADLQGRAVRHRRRLPSCHAGSYRCH